LATLFGLNRPLTLAATFINNPLLQPLLVAGSLQLGHLATHGSLVSLSPAALLATPLTEQLLAWMVGSLILSAIVGGAVALFVYVFLAARSGGPREREWRGYVNGRFRAAGWYARGFVRWKTRLDRIFGLLLTEDLGNGPVVDLGCGHGATLALVAFRDPRRTLSGCDLDAGRIEAASQGLSGLDAHLSTSQVQTFPLPPAGLILIIDVLQYLDPADQASLLRRCAGALAPGGRLIFRLPDTRGGPLGGVTRLLDRLLLLIGGWSSRPAYQSPEVYVGLLAEVGMSVKVQRYRNWLPLAHTLFFARKSAQWQ
jgi:trans-aconitate methyltransferase